MDVVPEPAPTVDLVDTDENDMNELLGVKYEHIHIKNFDQYYNIVQDPQFEDQFLLMNGCKKHWENKLDEEYIDYFGQHARIVIRRVFFFVPTMDDFNILYKLFRLSRKIRRVTFIINFDPLLYQLRTLLDDLFQFANLICERNIFMGDTLLGKCTMQCWKLLFGKETSVENINQEINNLAQSRVIYDGIKHIKTYPDFY